MAAQVRVAESGIHHDVKIKLLNDAGNITLKATSEYFETYIVHTTVEECRQRLQEHFPNSIWADDDHAVISNAHHLLCYRPSDSNPEIHTMAIMDAPDGSNRQKDCQVEKDEILEVQKTKNEQHGVVCVEFSEGALGIEMSERIGRYGARVMSFPRGKRGEKLPAEKSKLIDPGM